jgi:hypothetical protein
MPSVMDASELVESVETPDLIIETLNRPQPRRSCPGCWRPLAQWIATHLIPRRRERHGPSCSAHLPFESPADRLARQYPTLVLRAFWGI